jgi:hypothetical protein
LSPEQILGIRRIADHYIENAKRYQLGLKRIV